ncbi:nucleotidyl transferase AbiEii/AbiGii toxin family protein [Conexibacter woesei]|uniref:nucleotidyl transferase AbiEii/AbiGii toxin family protein n=1 Tax=Conexibacter woesei TaxID=191495 RepID=UPI00041AFAFD|nr:nucleotidyl transferase AbiEii/AbiGii toxin family protein [Conexibacter woesei]
MSIELLERGAAALGPLTDQVAFVGGATIALWITDPGAPAPRPTKDVDVVVEVTTRSALHAFETALRERGFSNDAESSVICRWRHDAFDLTLDAMPAAGGLLGFENPWQTAALPRAKWCTLPSGTRIRAATPPYLIATKLYAFTGRGGGDHLGSRDLEDIVLLVDGREELVAELADADADVRAFIAAEVGALLDERRFTDAVFGFLRADAASQERAASIVLPALRALAGR